MPDDDFERFQNKPAARSAQVGEAPETERNLDLRAQNADLCAQNADLRAQNAAWWGQDADLRELLADFREKNLGLREQTLDLREKLAAKNVECQALRARGEIDGFRHQMRVDDLEKQLALRAAEIVRLKQVMEQLMAEAPEQAENAVRAAPSGPQTVFVSVDSADTAELRGQLQSAREEYEKLRQATDNSLALKVARSIGRLLGKGAKQ